MSKCQTNTGAAAAGAPSLEDVLWVAETGSLVSDIDYHAAMQGSSADRDGAATVLDCIVDEYLEDLAQGRL